MECPQCQGANEAGRRFCAACGYTLSIPSTLSAEENVPPPTALALTQNKTEEAPVLLNQLLEHMDEKEEHYEINITITPTKIKAEGHYHDIKYSAALESKDGKPLFQALNESLGQDNVQNFVRASQQFAFALFERSFDLDNVSIPHSPEPKHIPAHTDGEHAQSVAMPDGGARVASPVPDGVVPPAWYAPILFPTATTRPIPFTRRFFLALVAIVVAVIGGYTMLGLRHDAAQGTRVTTDVPQRVIAPASVAQALPHGWPVNVPSEVTRAIVMLGTSRQYSDDKMVALANVLLTARLGLKFLDDFRSRPSLLMELFTDVPGFDTLLTIEECRRGMEAVFNSRWDIANWSKTALEAKKLALLEAIASSRGDLGAYMMRKEREFRKGANRDQTALPFPY